MSQGTINVTEHFKHRNSNVEIIQCHRALLSSNLYINTTTRTMSKLFMYLILSDISNLKIENIGLILICHDAHQTKFKRATITQKHT